MPYIKDFRKEKYKNMNNTLLVFLVVFTYGITAFILLLGCAWIVNKLYPDNNNQQTAIVNNRLTRTSKAA